MYIKRRNGDKVTHLFEPEFLLLYLKVQMMQGENTHLLRIENERISYIKWHVVFLQTYIPEQIIAINYFGNDLLMW